MAHLTTAPDPAPLPLPAGISSRQIDLTAYGHLSYHILEAGSSSDPLIVLLHGFPQLAFSWRKVILPLAQAGPYHVIAPDQRGFGRTTGWDSRVYGEVDLHNFSTTMYVRDVLVLVSALGYKRVKCLVGIDAGAVTAAAAAVIRPDVFESVVLLTHPFNGMPKLPFNINTVDSTPQSFSFHSPNNPASMITTVNEQLKSYNRKHYKWYYATQKAHADMAGPTTAGGLRAFLRGYFHVKSGAWSGNKFHPLIQKEGGENKQQQQQQRDSWPIEEVLKMPHYYIMPLEASMPETIAQLMTNETPHASKDWLTDEDLEVFVSEFARTSFQGGLNWYRAHIADDNSNSGNINKSHPMHDLDVFAGMRITIPCAFIGGDKDWGTYQQPGAIEKMTGKGKEVCDDFRLMRMVKGAGHWVPEERPDEVVQGVLELIRSLE